ncbi:helix-turn-helix transcriptional regulator [Streptomyces sp. DSM 42041]|uniref:Helix-turn-helix transcriptional regulator n=1 Tax=Streptomyces hazeniae TaxID=3075538 RepID=A0ABU2NWL2_9ACTN|nr:helix-turn-helix transcriptional regulator [Streptomyces sp. DSM 42041]MDT0381372.1 helix-turn-helix transcriptional regulator [Streptomyces sp. DSM 42041]
MFTLKTTRYRQLAEDRGLLTYEQKADAVGIGIATAHRIENGGGVGPSVAARLMRFYGVSFTDLFEVKDGDTAAEQIATGLAA